MFVEEVIDVISFCLICFEFELMCVNCVGQYIRECKMCGYEICWDLMKFFKLILNDVFCENCYLNGVICVVVVFCFICE